MKQKKLRKSYIDKSFHGVCGGIAEYFGISSFSVRLIFFFTMPSSLFVYVILANALDDTPRSL
ncbi:PspC domain-containing protein [Pseudalkalibacillus berkeleyi]|uniref:PspC domain-containing protein n=1 Tax=Pseudalkalibacillus berkeleyi TaxID=1069813 RepID=A0ABS9GUY7_9BACL|nr:PspC domain-containing protein [Pseudalkalibacillus berkeleyi]MCF6136648.1 PspC domain-containing protein [Pseudalkalibacillus berkeleyi]